MVKKQPSLYQQKLLQTANNIPKAIAPGGNRLTKRKSAFEFTEPMRKTIVATGKIARKYEHFKKDLFHAGLDYAEILSASKGRYHGKGQDHPRLPHSYAKAISRNGPPIDTNAVQLWRDSMKGARAQLGNYQAPKKPFPIGNAFYKNTKKYKKGKADRKIARKAARVAAKAANK